jgi:hypothetical protein
MSDAPRRPPPLPQHALIWIVVAALVLVLRRLVSHERVALAQRLTRSEPAANIQSPGKVTGRNTIMMEHPVIRKVLCAALVGSLLLPLGSLLLPYLDIPVLPFDVMEAVVSATLGFGIAEWLS